MVNRLIQSMIVIVIGLALLPVIVDFVDDFVAEHGEGGAIESLVELLPVLYVIILVVGAISYMAVGKLSK